MKPISRTASLFYRWLRRAFTLDITWLMVLDRKQPAPRGAGPVTDISARLLTRDDINWFAKNPEYYLSTELASRLTSGMDFCVGVFVNDDLASYAWFATQSIEAEHNRGDHPRTGVELTFPSHMAFMYKGFTVPRYRGRGLYKTVPQYALELLADRGIGSILSTADWSNAPALVSCARLGFRPIGRVCVVGLANLVWRKRPTAARQLGIHGGVIRRTVSICA